MQKKKKTLMKIVFGRAGIMLFLVMLQIIVLGAGMKLLGDFFKFVAGGSAVLSALITVYIINRNDNSAYKLAWILPVLMFPVFGGLFYIYVRSNFSAVALKKRMWEIRLKTWNIIDKDYDFAEKLKKEKGQLYRLGKYIEADCGLNVYSNSSVKYFSCGEEKFYALLKELEKAEKFIFLEYFIISEGYAWDKILKILEKKASEGLEVRVLYDGMGTLFTLTDGYERILAGKGIKAKVFMPVTPLLSTIQNNRDHRKIAVIDGKTAFNGSDNIADEYINKISPYGHWKDAAVKVSGKAVKSYTMMFLQMWNISSKENEDYKKYVEFEENTEDYGYVCAFADNPFTPEREGKVIYSHILNTAENYVHIMTPYFLPDEETLGAICTAAKSGIDVKMIIPHIPDKKIPFIMARSYYNTLLEAGVKIYEYEKGFIHSKVFVSDGKKAVVGTVNLDYRSFYLHFECGTYFEDLEEVGCVEEDFAETLKSCIEVSCEYYRKLPFLERTAGRFLRIFAPLM